MRQSSKKAMTICNLILNWGMHPTHNLWNTLRFDAGVQIPKLRGFRRVHSRRWKEKMNDNWVFWLRQVVHGIRGRVHLYVQVRSRQQGVDVELDRHYWDSSGTKAFGAGVFDHACQQPLLFYVCDVVGEHKKALSSFSIYRHKAKPCHASWRIWGEPRRVSEYCENIFWPNSDIGVYPHASRPIWVSRITQSNLPGVQGKTAMRRVDWYRGENWTFAGDVSDCHDNSWPAPERYVLSDERMMGMIVADEKSPWTRLSALRVNYSSATIEEKAKPVETTTNQKTRYPY
jgi:hypothetical protein